MPVYSVSYDLRAPGRNYEPLWAALRAVDSCRPLLSLWLIDVVQTAAEVRDNLKTFMDANDGILVTEITVGAGWAYSNIDAAAAVWLKRKLP